MLFIKYFFLPFFLPCLLSIALLARASEEGNSESSGSHGDVPHHAASTAAGGDKPWVRIQNHLMMLKTERAQLLENMKHLKQDKSEAKPGSPEIKAKIDELVKVYKEYRDLTEEFNKQLAVLKYRYPERLSHEERQQLTVLEVESQEKLEEQLNLDTRLSQAYDRAKAQYRSNEKERSPSSVPVQGEKKKAEESTTIREQDPILLSQ